jgi:hypothetical protein
MKITMKSDLTGRVSEREIDVTPEQIDAHNAGTLAQDAFPTLSSDDREFLMTGITPEEWENTFKEII